MKSSLFIFSWLNYKDHKKGTNRKEHELTYSLFYAFTLRRCSHAVIEAHDFFYIKIHGNM